MAERIVGVVCSHWPQRRDNAARIIQDLFSGTVKPDHVILLDNNPAAPRGMLLDAACAHGQVSVIEGTNWECRGKFVAALLDPADYYILMDDDTSVGSETLKCFMRWAHQTCVFGYWGVRLLHDPGHQRPTFMGGQIIFPSSVSSEVEVDAFHGRGMFCSYRSLVRMLALEEFVRVQPQEWRTEGDDLIIGLANSASVVPMNGPETFIDLDPGSEAMQNAPGYFAMRDEFLQAVLRAREAHAIPPWN